MPVVVRNEIYELVDSMNGVTKDERIQLAILNVLYDTKYPSVAQASLMSEEMPMGSPINLMSEEVPVAQAPIKKSRAKKKVE